MNISRYRDTMSQENINFCNMFHDYVVTETKMCPCGKVEETYVRQVKNVITMKLVERNDIIWYFIKGCYHCHPDTEIIEKKNIPQKVDLWETFEIWNEQLAKYVPFIKQFIKDDHKYLILHGMPGTGKSKLANILTQLMRGVYYRWTDLSIKFGHAYNKGSETEGEVISYLIKPDFVAIDDMLINPNISLYVYGLIYKIIEDRAEKKTLLVLNNIDDLFKNDVENRVYDRLTGKDSVNLAFIFKSYRQGAKQ